MFQIVPCLVGGLFLFVLLTEFHPASAADAIRPNLIFIMADDPGYGEVGCYGQKMIQTPHLDQMAAEGMRFMQFYAVLCRRNRLCTVPIRADDRPASRTYSSARQCGSG